MLSSEHKVIFSRGKLSKDDTLLCIVQIANPGTVQIPTVVPKKYRKANLRAAAAVR